MTLQLNSVNLQLNSVKCKQRVVLCHIGLVKDYGGHLINQPFLSLFESWKTTVGDQISTITKKQTQNMVKKMCRWKRIVLYTDEWIEFSW